MNIYYSPEKFGLEIVGTINWVNEPYTFNLTVVWRRPADGQLFYASDAGCSCPSPFEDSHLDNITAATAHEISGALLTNASNLAQYHGDEDSDISNDHAMQISELMGRLI